MLGRIDANEEKEVVHAYFCYLYNGQFYDVEFNIIKSNPPHVN